MSIVRRHLGSPLVHATGRANQLAHEWSTRSWVPERALQEFPDAAWDWTALSKNVAVASLEFIDATSRSLPWDWCAVSARPDVSPDAVERLSAIPWRCSILRAKEVASSSAQLDLDEDELVRFIHHEADTGKADPELVRRNVHLPLDFRRLSCCASLHDLAIETPELGWDWVRVSIYATADRFAEHPDLFDVKHMIAGRRLSPNAQRRIAAAVTLQASVRRWSARRLVACLKIQRAYMQARFDPRFAMCRSRLASLSQKWGMKRSRDTDTAQGGDDDTRMESVQKAKRIRVSCSTDTPAASETGQKLCRRAAVCDTCDTVPSHATD